VSQASRKQKESKPIAGHVITNLREVLVFASLVVAVYLFIALITYHPDDPGWSHSVTATEIHNSAGTIGAWIADIMLYVFGYFGYVIPIMFMVSGWRWFQLRRKEEPFNQVIFSVRGVAIFFILMGGCGIAWMHFLPGGALPHEVRGAGGILGDAIGSLLQVSTGDIGSTLIMLSMLLIGVTLYTGLSWLNVMDTTGQLTLNSIAKFRNRASSFKDEAEGRRAKKDREHLLKQEQEIVEQRVPPKIQEVIPEVKPSVREIKEKQESLFEPDAETALPTLSLLDDPVPAKSQYSKEALEAISRQVEIKLKDFGVSVEVVAVHPGPVITRFELDPAPGVKGSRIINLSKDLARSLSVISVRIVDVIPGKPYIGLEIPNESRELVSLIEIINTAEYDGIKSPMAIALGKDISGKPIVTDLGKMPHLLVAGTTGSGKSVALNAMILSLLYKSTASDVRMIMIDPKMLELSVYEGIPNLLTPVVTDMKEAANALRWCVAEMEKRYKLMSALGVRNIAGYNKKVMDAKTKGNPILDPFYVPFGEDDPPRYLEKLPFIVVIIDELADMMMTVGKKVEELIARLAQKARAAGVHLILATQRPSVDVITGLIKANVPSRIAFQVSSKIDSRTILDQMGAESLLGHGDMLYLPGGTSIPERVHGAFVSDNEVHKVVADLKSRGEPDYIDEILSGPAEGGADAIPGIDAPQDDMDPLYDEAVQIVTETRKASISYIQRRLRIGYNRAARIVEEMERSGLVGPLESNGSREVLAGPPPPVD
jgi:S-DNA-T family DNA segregation ATPase FtsK/SpoIIIE